MRIAIVYDCLFPLSTGGGERQYAAFARQFVEAGHEVTYLTRRQWDGRPPQLHGLDIRAIARYADLYDEEGTRRLTPAVGFALSILRHFARHRHYDAVLVSALPVLNVLAVRAALLGRHTVICADFLEVWRSEQWIEYAGPLVGRLAQQLQRLAIRLTPLGSCHSEMNAARLRSQGLRLPPIVSPGLIEEVSGDPVLTEIDPPTVMFAGRMIPDKRVDAIPAAVAWARAEFPDLRACLLGEGPMRPAVQQEVTRLSLREVIDLPGFVREDELLAALRNATCLINPSRREGYGIIVVEANAAGTPVVLVEAEDNASIELITPGVNGVIAPSTDPEVLGRAIVDVVTAGASLRATTYNWFSEAVKTNTMAAAADGILNALTAARRGTKTSP